MFDFDSVVPRKDTDSLKYDFALRRSMPEDVLPLWVADMDFPAPPCVVDALTEKSRHGIFGYSDTREDYFEILARWFESRFSYAIRHEWLVKTPGVVYALCAAIRAFTKPGEAVLIQPPVYYPFSESILSNGRRLVENPLVLREGHYEIDFENFEEAILRHEVKLFLLCSPHNPVGRVWTKEELLRLGDICLKHHVTVVSDEIHQDFSYPSFTHHIFASLKPELSSITVTLTAPTKTFNLAGLQISNIFIADHELRRRFKAELTASGYSQPNVMGITACKAAYEKGGPWLGELKQYLYGNLQLLGSFLEENLPKVHLVQPEGTYLCWLDTRNLGLPHVEVTHLVVQKAKLWLDEGMMFGTGGEGFQRINIACPRSVLHQALTRLTNALA